MNAAPSARYESVGVVRLWRDLHRNKVNATIASTSCVQAVARAGPARVGETDGKLMSGQPSPAASAFDPQKPSVAPRTWPAVRAKNSTRSMLPLR
jgi:hypothetical protein